ncbi:Vitamin B12 transporter BtuB [Alphaproteobacteria bacterium SO-S41]|nr:Vitamin B12 transporter BtuB [Alphaproteobacteria bacterium SO-S41]
MTSRAWLLGVSAGVLTGAFLAGYSASAAEPSANDETETIVVTAQKRATNLQKVPLSVAAVTAKTLESAGISTLDSVQRLTPGMNMSSIGSGFVSYTYIRGAGTNVIDSGSDPSVAFFVDEVYIAGTAGLQFDLLDIERIEVLKGPQGTLFGRNAAGGAVSIITKRPSDTLDAWASADVGDYGLFAVRGGVTGPFAEGSKWAYRLAAAHRQRDAFTDNPAGLDPGFIDNYTARGQVMYQDDSFTFLLTGDYFTSDNGMSNFFLSSANKLGLLTPAAVAALPADQSFYRVYYNVDGFEQQDTFSLTARMEGDIGFAKLTSISAYRDNQFVRLQDQDGSRADGYALGTDQQDVTFSQELRLSQDTDRLHWIAGIYYYHNETKRQDTLDSGPDFAVPALQNSFGFYGNNITTESYAIFGQATYEIFTDFSVTLGARYSKDKKTSDQRTDPLGPGPLFTAHLTPEWDSFDPAVILEYQVTPDIMLYGSYRQGYKSGGFQSLPGSLALALNVYAPEEVKSYEVGAKTQFFDNRLRVNVALFDTRIDNQQILRIPTAGTSIIDNAGKTRTQGVDVSISAVLSDYFRIDWSSTFQHARFEEYLSNCAGTPPVCGANFAGNRQLRSPDFQTSVTAEANIPLGGSGELTLRGEYAYQSQVFFDAANTTTPGTFQPGYGIFNARITYTPPAGNWDVSVFGKNLSDEEYYRNVAISGPSGVGTPGDPMTFGVTLNWRLD